jgi:hypothetical protein
MNSTRKSDWTDGKHGFHSEKIEKFQQKWEARGIVVSKCFDQQVCGSLWIYVANTEVANRNLDESGMSGRI